MIKTVTLSETETMVDGLDGFFTNVHNLSNGAVYASKYPNISVGADEVAEIPAGAAKVISTINGKVYLVGNGKVEVTGQDSDSVNCNTSAVTVVVNGGEGGGVSRNYVDTQDEQTLNSAKDYTDKQIDTANTSITDLENNKVGKTEISNPNLLDNWYFVGGGSQKKDSRFPINQRGQAYYTGKTVYAFDRWRIAGTVSRVSILDDCVRVSAAAAGGYPAIKQDVENVKDLAGKTVTISCLIKAGSTANFSIHLQNADTYDTYVTIDNAGGNLENRLISATTTLPKEIRAMRYGLAIIEPKNADEHCDIIAVKLELGNHQTLAHQDENGNWVLNDPPPNMALELTKCRRHYRVYGPGITGITHSGNRLVIILPFDNQMRGNSTCSLLSSEPLHWYINGKDYLLSNCSIASESVNQYGISPLVITGTWDSEPPIGVIARFNRSNTLLFSVDSN